MINKVAVCLLPAGSVSWGEGDAVTINIPYGLDVYYIDQPHTHPPPPNPCFPIGLVKARSDFIVRSAETGLGRRMLVIAVISVDAYRFLAFSDLTCHLQDTGIGVFWFHCAT